MARGLSPDGAKTLAHRYFPAFLRQRDEANVLDTWHRGEQEGTLYKPRDSSEEYNELADAAPNSWAGLIVTAVVQNAELVGIRMPGKDTDNLIGWRSWQRNQMDAKQPRLYRGSCAHGLAYVKATKARDAFTGEPMSRWRLVSARSMAAFYADDDEWPMFAIEAQELQASPGQPQGGWLVTLSDEVNDYTLLCKSSSGTAKSDWEYLTFESHGAPVCPVVQYAPNVDIDNRANSDLQGLIPLLSRIDQDTFDRLIVQRFGAWKVRYVAGMTPPKTPEEEAAAKLRLSQENILIAQDKDTKFGTLDATSLDGYISARDSDLRDLSALSQTPPHHMLGLSSNLQAESLAAAEAGLQRKSREHRLSWGESHEQLFRLDAYMRGDMAEAQAYEMEARWRDTESRSLEQAAMALGMLATNLKVPVEMLWERIPGWTAYDVERAKDLMESGGLDALIQQALDSINGDQGGDNPPPDNTGNAG